MLSVKGMRTVPDCWKASVMKITQLHIPDMCCPQEGNRVEHELGKIKGVRRVRFDYASKTAEVEHELEDETPLKEAVRELGMACRLKAEKTESPASAPFEPIALLSVPDMDCPVEEGEIRKAFEKAGVTGAAYNTVRREIKLPAASVKKALSAIAGCGYEASLKSSDLALAVPGLGDAAAEEKIRRAFESAGIGEAAFDSKAHTVTLSRAEDLAPAREALASIGISVPDKRSERRRIVLAVKGLTEGAKSDLAAKALAAAGITGAVINPHAATVTMTGSDADAAAMIGALREAGFESEEKVRKTAADDAEPIAWKKYAVALLIALLSEFLDLLSEYRPELLPVSGVGASLLTLIPALIAIVMTGVSTYKSGVLAVVHGHLNMNALMAVAVTGAVLIGAWPEAAMVMVLFEISEAFEQYSMTKARRSIRDLMSVAPETALVKVGGEFRRVRSETVEPGALVRVAPGERVPLDGKIEEGTSSLDQSMVTGESVPADKGPGASVWAGTVNLTSTIDVRVTSAASDSLTARIIDAVENAQASKAPVQRFVDRFAEIYTPIVFVVAALTAVVPPIFLGDWLGWLYKGLCLLVIACPCALVISTPVTVVSGLATATRCGLLIKGGLYLEQARRLVSIGLDKTGTLTKGEPDVTAVTFVSGDRRRAAQLAASLAAANRHPLSKAIVRWAKAQGIEPEEVEGFTALPGAGVEGRVAGGEVRLVNLRWLEEHGLAGEKAKEAFAEYSAQGMSSVALADMFGVLAVFGLADTLKPETASGIRQLRAAGIEPYLLTGDNAATAKAIAARVGIRHVFSDLLPEDKLKKIEELHERGPVAMVGDGINDAPALARADIGIAMGVRGTDSAIEAADIAVMDDRISSIATLVRLSRITYALLVENITFALVVKAVFAVLAILGYATMWMAVFADTGTTLIVVANAMRMLRMKPRLDRMARRAEKETLEAAAAEPAPVKA
ncbi:MAG: Heavy metal translocating P-type ATPase [Burkholderia sp.]|jgi:Zn2+/Cd2+-exporting ATPase